MTVKSHTKSPFIIWLTEFALSRNATEGVPIRAPIPLRLSSLRFSSFRIVSLSVGVSGASISVPWSIWNWLVMYMSIRRFTSKIARASMFPVMLSSYLYAAV